MSDGDHQPSRTRVPMPVAALSDPHMGDAAKNPDRVEKIIAGIFVLAIVFIALFGAGYLQNWKPWILGGTLGIGLFFLGFGLTAWGKYLMPQGPFVEERHSLASTREERDAMSAALVERSAVVVKRRKMLGGLFAVGAGIFGIVAVFPLLRSLGPLPGDSLDVTDWRKGTVLVDSNGRPVRRETLVVGGIMTVYPQNTVNPQTGYITDQGQAVDQTVLIRLSDQPFTTVPGREDWTPDGYVAYSKLCTHLGCPVGLYEQELELLVCPCHQSMFNVRDGAVPEFGPAPRPLPQMHLGYNDQGYLIAMAPYDQAGRARLLRADTHERHRRPRRSAAPRRPGAPSARSARSSTSSTTGSGWPRAAASSSTRSSRTTGPSCWARSRSIRSSCCWPPGSSCRCTSSPRPSRSSTTAATRR